MKNLSLFIFGVFLNFTSFGQTDSKPNIIIVFMDDMGYGDLGSYGALGYVTPAIDRLAANGIRFTNFHTPQAVCSASRAALLTGAYPNRVGIHGALGPNAGVGLASQEVTIAEVLKSKGYATSMIGKWHLGSEPQFLPTKQGFDEYYGLTYSNDMWPVGFDGKPVPEDHIKFKRYPVLPLLQINSSQNIPDTVMKITNLNHQAQLTGLYTKQALEFIDKQNDEPFFLYMAHSMMHVPIGASNKFKGKSEQGLYGDVAMEVDESMHQILAKLKEKGIDQQTLIIFTSDNGPWLNFGDHGGSTAGLREGKGTSWEGGTRVPCIISWPNGIAKGEVSHQLMTTMDILPTLAAITGAELPSNRIDGINMLNLLRGDDVSPRKSMYYYYKKNDLEAVRIGQWKLVFPHQYRSYEGVLPRDNGFAGRYNSRTVDSLELYDLRRDPGERYNVIKQYPEIVKRLEALADEARKDLGDNLRDQPGENRRSIGKIKK